MQGKSKKKAINNPAPWGRVSELRIPMEESHEKEVQAEKILKKYVWGGAGIGLVPVPLLDMVALTALQIKLIHALARVYEVPFSEQRVKALLAALLGSGISVVHAPKLAGTLKLLPLTAPVAFLSCSGLSAAITHAVGRIFILHFATGGTLLDCDPEAMREYYFEQFSGQPSAEKKNESSQQISYAGIKP
ncbi:MAG: DUF697 domain-containing protein [Candidatus Electrothrix sp. EH2]|nr:DUF697 domain-containing protein [Candidatus Electrothrix sp. EH2]